MSAASSFVTTPVASSLASSSMPVAPSLTASSVSTVVSVSVSVSGVLSFPLTRKSTSPWNIPPAVPPMNASSSTPASTSSFSGLYPCSIRFCNIAAAPSCAPSTTVVPAALCILLFIPSIDSGPSLSNTFCISGICKFLPKSPNLSRP